MTTTAPTCGLSLDPDETECNVQHGASLEQERIGVVSCASACAMYVAPSRDVQRRNAMRKGAVRLRISLR